MSIAEIGVQAFVTVSYLRYPECGVNSRQSVDVHKMGAALYHAGRARRPELKTTVMENQLPSLIHARSSCSGYGVLCTKPFVKGQLRVDPAACENGSADCSDCHGPCHLPRKPWAHCPCLFDGAVDLQKDPSHMGDNISCGCCAKHYRAQRYRTSRDSSPSTPKLMLSGGKHPRGLYNS